MSERCSQGTTRSMRSGSTRSRTACIPALRRSSGTSHRRRITIRAAVQMVSAMAVRALVFDAYGTLYDVQSVRDLATELCGDKGELITQLWRLKQLEYTWLRGLMRNYADFWQVTGESLDFAVAAAGA